MHRALEAAKIKVGGASALARALRITPQAVNQWQVVPPERVLEVERHSGVSRHFLRPDVFGSSQHELPASSSVGDDAGAPISPPAQDGAPADISSSHAIKGACETGAQLRAETALRPDNHSNSPDSLPSGEAVARCEVRPRATATNSGEVVR
ncbi:Cro/CI family transcriptional regulator [Brucella rhizosphaerae]|uniref:transcriptional regulator n=1 Tax=Brucella rhizosphaerae TaxID=571254 RepID=UPI0004661928